MSEQITKEDIEAIRALKREAERSKTRRFWEEKGSDKSRIFEDGPKDRHYERVYEDAPRHLADKLEKHCDQLCELALEGLKRRRDEKIKKMIYG